MTLEAGARDYDLTEGIVYDSALYELAVLDTGDFDINVPGAYEVTYSLTPITETPEGEDPAEDMDDSDALDPDVDGADQDGDTADQPDTGNGGDTTTGTDNGTGNANSGDTTVNSGNAAAESDAGASMTTGDATAAQSDSGNDVAVQSVEDAASTQAIIKVNDRGSFKQENHRRKQRLWMQRNHRQKRQRQKDSMNGDDASAVTTGNANGNGNGYGNGYGYGNAALLQSTYQWYPVIRSLWMIRAGSIAMARLFRSRV